MKTLNAKFSILSLLVLFAITAIFTACGKQEKDNLTTERQATQIEKEQAQAEVDLIMTYGQEVIDAYNAYVSGQTLKYYSPLGIIESVDFDWSNYAVIMEHSKIMDAVEQANLLDVYTQNIAEGSYLTMEDVERLTPGLFSNTEHQNDAVGTRTNCEIVEEGEWTNCGPCNYVGYCVGCCGGGCVSFYFRQKQCKHISTTCSCYHETRYVGC